MILADKIIEERKKLRLSQEELAEKLNVSRQAVSKWESAQTIPDLQKIVAMSSIFSVSTDYLLKDEIESNNISYEDSTSDRNMRCISMEEANEFMDAAYEGSKKIALGVLLCILSPIPLIMLSGIAEEIGGISDTLACVIGLSSLFIMVAVAVYMFIQYGIKTEKFRYLEKEVFETAYGVTGLVKEKKNAFEPKFIRSISFGVMLCILSPIPLIISSAMEFFEIYTYLFASLLLCILAIAIYMLVHAGIIKSSYQILLQEENYDRNMKRNSSLVDTVSSVYWCLMTAIYLGISFLTNSWDKTWIIWPVAGVIFAPIIIVIKAHSSKDNK